MAGRKFECGRVEWVKCVGCGKPTTSGIDGCVTLELCRTCFEKLPLVLTARNRTRSK